MYYQTRGALRIFPQPSVGAEHLHIVITVTPWRASPLTRLGLKTSSSISITTGRDEH